MVGQEVVEARIGLGPIVWRWRFSGVPFHFRRYPFASGLVRYFSIDRQARRSDIALITAAGPVANLTFGAAFLTICWAMRFDGFFAAFAGGIALSELTMGAFNLIPRSFGDDEGLVSDGQGLLNLLKPKGSADAHVQELLNIVSLTQTHRYAELIAFLDKGIWMSPFRLTFASNMLHALSRIEGDQAALGFYKMHQVALGGCGETEQDTEKGLPWVQANVAWSAIKSGDPEWQPLADTYSAAALAAVPDAPETQGTRGAWLIRQGEVENGLEYLREAVRGAADFTDRADFCRFIALGFRKLENLTRAEGFEALEAHFRARALAA